MTSRWFLLAGVMLALPNLAIAQSDEDDVALQIAKQAGLWTLKHKFERPRWISMNHDLGPDNEDEVFKKEADGKVPGTRGADYTRVPSPQGGSAAELRVENYWYVYFELTNDGEDDRRIFIDLTARSDSAVDYHDVYSPATFNKVRAILEDQGKLKRDEKLHSQVDLSIPDSPDDLGADAATRKISQAIIKAGETKKCVAIFPRLDEDMDKLTISVRGLSNDVTIAAKEDHRREISERVLQLEYKRLGNPHFTADKDPEFVTERWLTEKRSIKTDLRSP